MMFSNPLRRSVFCVALLSLGAPALLRAQQLDGTVRQPDVSLRNEVGHAIDQGLAWLKTQQKPEGYWSNADFPALTALALTAYEGDPSLKTRHPAAPPDFVSHGYDWLLTCAKPDGGIYNKGLSNYNTSIAITALVAAHEPRFGSILASAREFVVRGQVHAPGNPADGGFSYDAGGDHADLSNTVYALEALYQTRNLGAKPEGTASPAPGKDLDWQAAIGFLQRCQNLPEYNKEPWASDDPQNKGGFVYLPGKSTAGTTELGGGKQALRSYGTMTYAGLLSFVYADLKRDDPRVTAAYGWLQANYSVDENPGMGQQGLYYHFDLMAKALTAYGVGDMDLKDGKKANWREDVAKKLINLQNKDGYWQNENGRWFEKDPVLATAYSLIALELINRGL